MTDNPTDEEAKEFYEHFGLGYDCSGVLANGIAHALLILELLEGRAGVKTLEEWEALVDKHFEKSFEKTLGKLKSHLARHQQRSPILSNVMPDLDRCVCERSFLAHHFWREYATRWFTALGRERMVQWLAEARELFSETDRKLEAAMRPFAERHGFTPDLERAAMELIAHEACDFPQSCYAAQRCARYESRNKI
jgi:hypothetical protein